MVDQRGAWGFGTTLSGRHILHAIPFWASGACRLSPHLAWGRCAARPVGHDWAGRGGGRGDRGRQGCCGGVWVWLGRMKTPREGSVWWWSDLVLDEAGGFATGLRRDCSRRTAARYLEKDVQARLGSCAASACLRHRVSPRAKSLVALCASAALPSARRFGRLAIDWGRTGDGTGGGGWLELAKRVGRNRRSIDWVAPSILHRNERYDMASSVWISWFSGCCRFGRVCVSVTPDPKPPHSLCLFLSPPQYYCSVIRGSIAWFGTADGETVSHEPRHRHINSPS